MRHVHIGSPIAPGMTLCGRDSKTVSTTIKLHDNRAYYARFCKRCLRDAEALDSYEKRVEAEGFGAGRVTPEMIERGAWALHRSAGHADWNGGLCARCPIEAEAVLRGALDG